MLQSMGSQRVGHDQVTELNFMMNFQMTITYPSGDINGILMPTLQRLSDGKSNNMLSSR